MKTLLSGLLLMLILLPAAPTVAESGCADGTTGNDSLTCSVTPPTTGNDDDQFDADLGDDIMVQEAGVSTVDMDGDGSATHDLRGAGDGGDDTMTNYGTITASIAGDWASGNGGNDTIYNYGQIDANIMGDEVLGVGGNDTIINAGTVENAIHGEGGDDTVILTDGASGGADHILLLDGGPGAGDVLTFSFSDLNVYNQVATALVGQSAANGSITIAGQTYTWTDFEELRNEAPSESAPTAAPMPNFVDSDTPSVSWTRVTWAVGYQIEWSDNPTFAGATQADIPVFQLYYTFPPASLSRNATYYWHVRAKRNDPAPIVWSARQELTLSA
jgi:hypothetical protein